MLQKELSANYFTWQSSKIHWNGLHCGTITSTITTVPHDLSSVMLYPSWRTIVSSNPSDIDKDEEKQQVYLIFSSYKHSLFVFHLQKSKKCYR